MRWMTKTTDTQLVSCAGETLARLFIMFDSPNIVQQLFDERRLITVER